MDKQELKIIARRLVEQYAAKELAVGFKPAGLHCYDDAFGNILYIRLRLKHSDGRKWIKPFYFNVDKQEWVIGEPKFTNGKPLYRLSTLTLSNKSNILVVEGEQKVEALEKLGFVATTSGSATSANKTDWSPLRGQTIIIWRDFDQSGVQYAKDVTKILSKLNCVVSYIDVDKLNLSDGDDIIDWLDKNPTATADDILALPTTISLESLADCHSMSGVELIQASSVIPEPISWLWVGWLAAGKLHIISGAPGSGKTTLCMKVAAIISSGGLWPDDTAATLCNVLIWSGEDDYKDTLVPRLIQAGADLKYIHIVVGTNIDNEKRCFEPAHDLEHLQQEIVLIGNVKLLIVDPLYVVWRAYDTEN